MTVDAILTMGFKRPSEGLSLFLWKFNTRELLDKDRMVQHQGFNQKRKITVIYPLAQVWLGAFGICKVSLLFFQAKTSVFVFLHNQR